MKRKSSVEESNNDLLLKDLYTIVQELLLKGYAPELDKSCFWVIGLSEQQQLLVVELMSAQRLVELEAQEIFQVPLQKQAAFVLLCERPHNQQWQLDEQALTSIHQLQQVGYLIDLPILDYLLIKEHEYKSLMQDNQLKEPIRERPPLTVEEAEALAQDAVEEAKQSLESSYYQDKEEIALHLYQEGIDVEQIVSITGLSEEALVLLLDAAK